MPWLTDYLESYTHTGTYAAHVLGTGWTITGGKLVGTSSQANVDRWAYPASAWHVIEAATQATSGWNLKVPGDPALNWLVG